mmetsp:Transcript_34096/g.55587  ORF Transcript_34096/g.55587 Transcript_34096/m.55587 type:complete len:315 (-) Transcript_34096:21-965(-)
MSHCIEQTDLIPWTLVLIGTLTHTLKRYIIDFKAAAKQQPSKSEGNAADGDGADEENQPESQQHPAETAEPETAGQTSTHAIQSSPSKAQGFAQSLWFRWLQYALILWEYVSVTAVFVLDILTFVRVFPDQTGWINYQCLVLIALNSANFKKGMLWFALKMARGEMYGEDEEDTADDVDTFTAVAEFPLGFAYMVYGASTIAHWFPGVILYIWVAVIILLSFVIVGAIIGGIYYLCGKEIDEAIMEGCYSYLNQMTIIFSAIILGITVIRFYDGEHYITSLATTFEERSFKNYLTFQTDTFLFSNFMQFVSWVF